MYQLTLVVALLSLFLSIVAYWRAGGKQEMERLLRESAAVRAKQRQVIAQAFENTRGHLQAARGHLRQLGGEAIAGLSRQIKRAQDELDALTQRLEDAIRTAADATVAAAQSSEETLAQRAKRLEARVTFLEAKAKTSRAVVASEQRAFDRAEELLYEATELLRDARETLGADPNYHEPLERMRHSLREASAAVRTHALDMQMRIEQVLGDTDRLVETLESDEAAAASAPLHLGRA